jgi:hypothetical protein
MNSDNKPFTLSYVRFCFTMEALDDSVLPPYLGSTLQGALGHALRQRCAFTYEGIETPISFIFKGKYQNYGRIMKIRRE